MKRGGHWLSEGRSIRFVAALLVLVCASVALAVVTPSALAGTGSHAANAAPTVAASTQRAAAGDSVTAFDDVTLPAGKVYQDVFSFGGDVVVHGTVLRAVVVVGGNLTIASDARIGTAVTRHDVTVVCAGGHVTTESGAVVVGKQADVLSGIGHGARALGHGLSTTVLQPWHMGGVGGWFGCTVGLVVIAVLAAAIAPRQLLTVSKRAQNRFWSSLGLGALAAIVIIPVTTVVLIVTIVGIIALVPWLGAIVPITCLFGYAAVGMWFGGMILVRSMHSALATRSQIIGAAALGAVVLSLLTSVPVIGFIAGGILWLVGLGAVVGSLGEWRRSRRDAKQRIAAGSQAAAPAAPSFPSPSSSPSA